MGEQRSHIKELVEVVGTDHTRLMKQGVHRDVETGQCTGVAAGCASPG